MALVNVISTATFIYHEYAAQQVRRISALIQDLQPTRPSNQRLFFWDAVPHRGERGGTQLVPVTYSGEQVAARRLQKIEAGQLADAFRLHLVMGDGHPTENETQLYPWWREYYQRMFMEVCCVCHIPLVEDRAMHRVCHHQLCTTCAVVETDGTEEGTLPACPECAAAGKWLIFNGEQANDDRDHSDIVLWMS